MKELNWHSSISWPVKKEIKMIWKTENATNREKLEKLLNSLESRGCIIDSVQMDQAQGNFIIIYKEPKTELFSD